MKTTSELRELEWKKKSISGSNLYNKIAQEVFSEKYLYSTVNDLLVPVLFFLLFLDVERWLPATRKDESGKRIG